MDRARKFWWVNHKKTVRQEIEGGYLWSPKVEKNGAKSRFYSNMRVAAPGDIIINLANAVVSHIGFVLDYALSSAKPAEFHMVSNSWAEEGWLLPVRWTKLMKNVRPMSLIGELAPFLPKKYSPIQINSGRGNQKAYLSEIEPEIFDRIIEASSTLFHLDDDFLRWSAFNSSLPEKLENLLENAISVSEQISSTEKEQLITARRGQGLFRNNVRMIEEKCRVTGLDNPNLLIASHIKPWRVCGNSYERLDGNNGLILAPHVDLLFDRGFVSFENNGRILISERLSPREINLLGLAEHFQKTPSGFNEKQAMYLNYHRQSVFL